MVHFTKNTIAIFLLLHLQIITFSQSITDSLTNALNQSRYNKPGDQVFLHLDRNLYYAGDTIRFQAYIRDRQSGIFGSESISLHSLLVDQSHRTIDSARFRIVNSTASGWLKIPVSIAPGNYSVLAFTSMMMNYDPEFVFSIPIKVDERKTFQLTASQITGKPIGSGYQISTDQASIDLRFLPEGGTFICGILQRVAFNAVTAAGRIQKVKGDVRNQRGEKVAEFISGEFGPGLVEFTPKPGETYLAYPGGKAFSGMKWPLPIPESSGIAMRVNKVQNEMVEVNLEGRGVGFKSYLLAVTMNNTLILSRIVRLDSLFRLRFNTDELPAGTAYITLYDNGLNPVAERLIFVNDHKKMNIEISSSSSVAECGDESELILNTTDYKGENISSFISIAVIDSASGFCKTLPFPDIGSTFLYDRAFYDNLPPGIRLRGLNSIDERSVDLMLMTYGWRKFNLQESSGMAQEKKLMDYDYLKISNLEPSRKDKMEVQILTLEDANIIALPVDNDKEAILRFISLSDSVRRIRILADTRSIKNLNSARIEFPQNRSFSNLVKQVHNEAYNFDISGFSLTDSSAISNTAPDMKDLFHPGEGVINIEEVIIRPRIAPPPPQVYNNKYEKLYMSGSIKTLTAKDFKACPGFEDILERFYPSFIDRSKQRVYFRGGPALIVVDDIPVFDSSYSSIASIQPERIASVTVLKGRQGFTLYGAAANGGVVFVTTKTGTEEEHKKNDDLLRSVRLFRTEIEYYIPTKEQTDTIPELQNRPTVLWMNEVFLDGNGPVKIRYPNNFTKGAKMVIVNGVSSTNEVGSNSYKYIVK
jgi:hypothetical protein